MNSRLCSCRSPAASHVLEDLKSKQRQISQSQEQNSDQPDSMPRMPGPKPPRQHPHNNNIIPPNPINNNNHSPVVKPKPAMKTKPLPSPPVVKVPLKPPVSVKPQLGTKNPLKPPGKIFAQENIYWNASKESAAQYV